MLRFEQLAETRRWSEVPQCRKMLLRSGQGKRSSQNTANHEVTISQQTWYGGCDAATKEHKGGKVRPGSETSRQGRGSHKSVITLVILELGPEKLIGNS